MTDNAKPGSPHPPPETPGDEAAPEEEPGEPPPGKPGDPNRGAAAGGGELTGPDTFGGYDDDMGRGAD